MINIKRTTPYPLGRGKKDKTHACYVIVINKKITVKINVWEDFAWPDYSVEVDPSNAVNPPAIQYYKWQKDNIPRVFNDLKEILNRDVKYATTKDLNEIKAALYRAFKIISKRTHSNKLKLWE